jgi:IMP cyclohydrolase
MNLEEIKEKNVLCLKKNSYPGRGIVLGLTPSGENYVQIYWIMGRSENSRNRIFVLDQGEVRTEPFDPAKVEDPSLIIYSPVKSYQNFHVVSNGDQTETILEALKKGHSFETALEKRTFEPDAPHYTPRIAGLIDLDNSRYAYKLAIIKSIDHQKNQGVWCFFSYRPAIPGTGHLITTYQKDGHPLPPFTGDPRPVPLFNSLEKIARYYWESLNEDNKISLLVKFINLKHKTTQIKIINKLTSNRS